jgi:hypothetical protein
VIDEARLREFEDHVGDQLPGLMGLFRSDLEQVLLALSSADSPAVMAKAAHSVLSLAGALGCAELVACARDLASAAEMKDPAAPRLAVDLLSAAARAAAALDARYATGA